MALVSCRRSPEAPGIQRLAVVTFENLTSDASLDWMGVAVVGMLSNGVNGSSRLRVSLTNTPKDPPQADQLLQGYYEKHGGGYRFSAVLRDIAAQREVWRYENEIGPAALASVAEGLARQLREPWRLRPPKNPDALRNWSDALTASSVPARAAALSRAIDADPDFGTAYADLAQLEYAASDPALGGAKAAKDLLDRARPHLGGFEEVDRVRLKLVEAQIAGDTSAQINQLAELARLIPGDGRALEQLAHQQLQLRQYAAASATLEKVVDRLPGDVQTLNQLGYVAALAGREDLSKKALEQYRTLQPDQPNPVDSLGETQFALGRFAEAEKYFLDAHSRAPAFLGGFELMKAAQARLLQGNVAGADELAQKYVKFRTDGHDALAEMQMAQWLYLTGRRKEGAGIAARLASATGDGAAYAKVQLAAWKLIEGDRQTASSLAKEAGQGTANPGLRNFAGTVLFLAQPRKSPAEWKTAAEQAAADPGTRRTLLGYALLLSGQYSEAIPALKEAFEQADPLSDGTARTLYAWALVESGRAPDAAPLVASFPLPLTGNGGLLAALEFPRFLSLRASVNEKQGKTADAAQARSLYQKLSGK